MTKSRTFNANQRLWSVFPEYYLNPWLYFTDFVDICRSRGARFVTFSEVFEPGHEPRGIELILDHHIDHYPVETEVLARWERDHGVTSNIFLFRRVVSGHPTQKKRAWTLEDLDLDFYKGLETHGFEIGYHHNAVGQVIGGTFNGSELPGDVREKALAVFAQDVRDLRKHFNVRCFIPHGGSEGNVLLDPLTEDFSELHWVYNKRPGSWPRWENFVDSSGQNLRTLRTSDDVTVLAARDSLHVRAWTASPGLHHVLLHPGRLGKGMPYELYSGYEELDDTQSTRMCQALYPGRSEDLPLNVPDIVRDWERKPGLEAREEYMEGQRLPRVRYTQAKYYLLTDCVTTLRAHLAVNPLCIGFLLHQEPLPDALRKEIRRSKGENRGLQTLPVQPDLSSFEDMERINELFRTQFGAYYNRLFAPRPWHFMAHTDLPFRHVVLRNQQLHAPQDAKNLARFLQRNSEQADVHIAAQLRTLFPRRVISALRNGLRGKEDSLEIATEGVSWVVASKVRSSIFVTTKGDRADSAPALVEAPPDSDTKAFAGEFRHWLPASSSPPTWATAPGDPHTSPAVHAHQYASQLLFCRRSTNESLRTIQAMGLPESWVETLQKVLRGRAEHPAFGGPVYRAYVRAVPSSELLYQYVASIMYGVVRQDSPRVNETSKFAWAWSFAARAAMEAWRRTGEMRFPRAVLDSFNQGIAPRRDSLLGRTDICRGRAVNAWGSRYYDEYAMKKGYEGTEGLESARWTANAAAAGRICLPVGLAVGAVLEASESGAQDIQNAQAALHVAKGALAEFLEDVHVSTDGCRFVYRRDRGGIDALNHQNSYAEALLVVGSILEEGEWTRVGTDIARYFKQSIAQTEDGRLVWGYKGFNAQPEMRESQRIEDIAHAHLNVAFARQCFERGIVFDSADMKGFAKTFTHGVYLGDKHFSPRISADAPASSLVMKSSYPDHFLCWIQLADFNPSIRTIVEETLAHRYDLFPNNWFGSPISSFAYAYRLDTGGGPAQN